jgi:hypothetical protein
MQWGRIRSHFLKDGVYKNLSNSGWKTMKVIDNLCKEAAKKIADGTA